MQRVSRYGRVASAILAGAALWLACSAAGMAQGGNSIAAVACQVSYTDGNFQNLKPNYVATANRAEFSFLAPMTAVGEGAMLYSAGGAGPVAEDYAAIKASIIRDGSGTLSVEDMELHWPFTVLVREGQYYSIIQMAHDQGVEVGLDVISGGGQLGWLAFHPGVFDPNQPAFKLDGETAIAIHSSLMGTAPLVMNLDAGGTTFSTVAPEPGAYGAFVASTLVEAMDEARRLDAEAPCDFTNPDAFMELLDF